MCRLKKNQEVEYFNHQGWRHWIQLAHCGLIILFVCCFYLYFFYGEVSWFLAKFVLRCIRACDCWDVSDNRIEFSSKLFGFGKVHCSKTHSGWIFDPWIGLWISMIWRVWEDLENFQQFIFNMQSGSVK